ncbi:MULTISPECIES: helix-turn-helix domain-containing protein [Streptomyces]|uniref:Helix-turn-helix domain-containing protein n=1 Tax=Streptomyces nondiastaticus TaxID=3154512 RepID=A0ABW6U988_9ACTN|nr:helix-turn-helix transcriptional regulator [Streptomyces sp. VNUA116]WKU46490.1 helix-turn-helix transcriptional regulator [Streptomyces sp. VNUA116]
MADITPTLLRRRLGAALKTMRVRAGLNLAEGAKLLDVSVPTLSKVENGRQNTDPDKFFAAYQVTDAARIAETREIAKLANDSRRKNIYAQYKDIVPERLADFLDIEQIATRIDLYAALVIPGVLQTADYAYAVINGGSVWKTAREVRAFTELRMKRQEVLASSSLALRCVLDEACLRRELGGPSVLRGQLEHLLTLSRQPNIELQVIPFKAGTHTGLDGAYTVFHFAVGSPVVAVEPLTTSHYLEEDGQVARYDVAFDRLRTQALDPEASRDFIARIAKEAQ